MFIVRHANRIFGFFFVHAIAKIHGEFVMEIIVLSLPDEFELHRTIVVSCYIVRVMRKFAKLCKTVSARIVFNRLRGKWISVTLGYGFGLGEIIIFAKRDSADTVTFQSMRRNTTESLQYGPTYSEHD